MTVTSNTSQGQHVDTGILQELFSEYSSREFVVVRPGGNAGDQLIYMGAEKVARQVGLSFTVVSYEEFLAGSYDRGTALYLHGGGGFNPIWSGKPMVVLEKAVKHPGVVIQGPQTFWPDLNFLQERVGKVIKDAACERLVIMAREKKSFELLQQIVPDPAEAILDHDTALNLRASDIDSHPDLGYVFYAIRNDKEAMPVAEREYSAVWGDPVLIARDFDGWVALHASAEKIVTNRLHSAILGSILGTPTTLCPNSYFKNRAVWEHSLQHRAVVWADEIPISAVSRALHQVGAIRRLHSLGWVQKKMRRSLGLLN